MYAVLQLLHFLSYLSKKIATETLKKTEKSLVNGFLLCFLCASVAKKIYPARGFHYSIHSKSVPNTLMTIRYWVISVSQTMSLKYLYAFALMCKSILYEYSMLLVTFEKFYLRMIYFYLLTH